MQTTVWMLSRGHFFLLPLCCIPDRLSVKVSEHWSVVESRRKLFGSNKLTPNSGCSSEIQCHDSAASVTAGVSPQMCNWARVFRIHRDLILLWVDDRTRVVFVLLTVSYALNSAERNAHRCPDRKIYCMVRLNSCTDMKPPVRHSSITSLHDAWSGELRVIRFF